MNLGEKISNLRKKIGYSQEQLAEQLGVTRQTISKWELNETAPDIKQAKELSKIFNVSLDELVENDVKSVLVEKVSNTEKLAGIIIKILKFIGIAFISLVVIDVIVFCLFIFIRKQPSDSETKSAVLNCVIEDKNCTITIGDDKYYDCNNCSKEMNVYLRDITDWANLDNSVKNVKKYFNGRIRKY